MAKPLIIGLVLGALFVTFLPQEIVTIFSQNLLLSYLAVLVVAMPLYVCATSSLPLAAGLMMSGISPGAAFIFLSAGPATNSVTMSVVAKMFGKRGFLIYILSIALLSIAFGYILDSYFGGFDIVNYMDMSESNSKISIIASVVL